MSSLLSTPPAIQAHPRLSQWLRIGPGRQLTVFTGKVELGQGIETALVQIACDGLGLTPAQVVLVAGHTDRSPDEGYTAGSLSVQYGGAALRWACAHAWSLFVARAAHRLDVSPSDLQVDAGCFSDTGGKRHTDYWELAAAIDLDVAIVSAPASIRHAPEPYVGRSLPRVDLQAKLTGAGYLQDLVIPGMQHVRMLRGRHPSQRLAAVPLAELRALPGVSQVVQSGRFLALVGPHEGALVRALPKARKLLDFDAMPDPHAGQDTVTLLQGLPASTRRVHEGGTPGTGLQAYSATYSRPYLAHASIGPACALADPRGGQLRVWSHTQGVYPLRDQIAAALGREAATVEVIHAPGAGCYGHNGADDAAFDAAFVATRIGQPVRVQWMREDEMTMSPFGSASVVQLTAGLDDAGRIGGWAMSLWSHTHMNRPGWGDGINLLGAWEIDPPLPRPTPRDLPLPMGGGDRNAIALYDLPHQQVDYHFIPDSPVRVSALRSLGSYANLYAIESFMDELAQRAGCDPVEFRLRHLGDPRARAVLEAAAEMAGWRRRGDSGSGSGLGIAVGRYKNQAAYCAIAMQVSVEEKVRVEKAWAVVDAGAVVNPDGLVNQIEGGLLQSLSWTLKESVTWDRSGITSSDWEHYPILGFDEIPKIAVRVIERPGEPSLGAGEAAAGPAAAAVANAVAHALDLRARQLPLSAERLAQLINAG
ncbi:molybdopterin cofactor-binding domain-containing protein [Variovorax sp. J31P207]|uniref:molybdopterin cofactor-binding domain-containing protein n=1 Tax=Variovorax sp. J31P207 TaxID=3053510 RepID=UPI0025789D4F|nr:molybdopterin cofactor-binding domain-containing protein [Variovorax sp. J31P207]MDM0066042.1 molybdopterin-dependent oxidoreductase [Variovorax sp. J31P207]